MNMVRIKICGITTLEDARYVAALGAHWIGFIQTDKSPRTVAVETAKDIIAWTSGPVPVGVFVDPTRHELLQAVDTAGFAAVQLHGSESPDFCARLPFSVIKAFRVEKTDTEESLRDKIGPYQDVVKTVLLDTHSSVGFGGTGQVFDWSVAAALAKETKIILAGGITPENVVEAVTTVRPFGIDVSSGVESAPGIKDFDKIDALFEALSSIGDQTAWN